MQVHAEDGDKGNPREIRYGLVSEGNPFTSFFDINDTSGKLLLIMVKLHSIDKSMAMMVEVLIEKEFFVIILLIW